MYIMTRRTVQGYPQRMRLQRQFQEICLVRFFASRVPGRLKLTYFVLNHLVNHQNSSFKSLYFLSFGSSLQSYYLWVTLYINKV